MLDNELTHRSRAVFKRDLSGQLDSYIELHVKNFMWVVFHKEAIRAISRALYEDMHFILQKSEVTYE